MRLPFSEEQFLGVFAAYNEAIWPTQVVAYAIAAMAVVLAARPQRGAGRFVAGVLAWMWVWTGWEYHIMHFAGINPAARVFGAVFILQGLGFAAAGVVRPGLGFRVRADAHGVVGAVLVGYAMALYPMIGYVLGHRFPAAPSFGVTPCPMVIFTFGMLLWAEGRVPGWLLAVPLLWSLVGFSAAVNLGMVEDLVLVAAGVVGTALVLRRNARLRRAVEASAE